MLLDSDRYEAVINYGKDAINKLNENELEEGFAAAEKGGRHSLNLEQSGIRGITTQKCFMDELFNITIWRLQNFG